MFKITVLIVLLKILITVGGPCGSPTVVPTEPHSEQGQTVSDK